VTKGGRTFDLRAKPGEINYVPVDRFTTAHFASGYLIGAAGVSDAEMLVAAVGFEILERFLKEWIPQYFPHPSQDTVSNAVVDVVALMVGGWIGRKYLANPERRKQPGLVWKFNFT
jgi:hypothetical protein